MKKKNNWLNNWFRRIIKDVMDERQKEVSLSYSGSGGSELSETYLFDFKKGYNQNDNAVFLDPTPMGGDEDSKDDDSQKPQKIKIKPVDVLGELEKVPTPFNLSNLDDKISVLKDKEEIIKQSYTKREVKALIERLENRKEYEMGTNKAFFDQFQNTKEELINPLLEKYKLVMESADLFVPEFPNVAISIMKKYSSRVKKICGKEPIYYVIAEAKDFEEKYDKRDPILLVQSPFGFYYQILGAWDKEMLLLSEL